MAVIRKRNKLVSFRVSEQEYEVLQNLIVSEGARSISDFARGALCDVLDHNFAGDRARPALPQRGGVNQTLEQLIMTMGELNQSIAKLSTLVENSASKTWEP